MTPYNAKINKLFYYWLLISFCLVFSIVIVGGLTRLTNSGLSITEWELFTGILPPLNLEAWNNYFSLYQKIPQYKYINENMTLNEFKVIFYWEYFHRVLARIIGIFFLVPFIFFYFNKCINRKYIRLCGLILSLIILQGVVGWYMVKSGLVNNITVSHYRLSLHLSIAFIIISLIFWCILDFKKGASKNILSKKKYSFLFYFLLFIIFSQVILGAFVSGLDAGKIYQTWPMMNYTYFPNDVLINKVTDFFNFENQGLIQFYHRNLAYLICLYFLLIGIFIYKKNILNLYKPYLIMFSILLIQVVLGILTLISGLNIYLASVHQICSLLLVLSSLNLYFSYIK